MKNYLKKLPQIEKVRSLLVPLFERWLPTLNLSVDSGYRVQLTDYEKALIRNRSIPRLSEADYLRVRDEKTEQQVAKLVRGLKGGSVYERCEGDQGAFVAENE